MKYLTYSSAFALLFILVQTSISQSRQMEAGDTLEAALGMYQIDCKEYPLTHEGLMVLTKKPNGKCPHWGPNPYLHTLPKDKWGNDLTYVSDGKVYVLKSLGKDGKPGGLGEAADIIYDKMLKAASAHKK